MQKSILKRLEVLEKDEVIEIEDLSWLYKEVFGEESEELYRYEESTKHFKNARIS